MYDQNTGAPGGFEGRRGGVVKLRRPADNFERIPRAFIQHSQLTQDSKFLGIWLCAKPEGWVILAKHVWRELSWTDKRWYGAAQNLRLHGFMKYDKQKTEGGHFQHQYELSLEPDFLDNLSISIPLSQFPLSGQPLGGERPHIHKTDQQKTDSKEDNNNARAVKNVVVVFAEDLKKSGLLNDVELQQIVKILADAPLTRRQTIADEVGGALRARGRSSPRGIKNLARFTASILNAQVLSYSADEAAIRAARAGAADRESNSFVNLKNTLATSHKASPCPPALKARLQAIKIAKKE